MNRRSHIAAILVLGSLAACRETPSYAVRWSLEGRGAPTTVACAESGIFFVQARAYLLSELSDTSEDFAENFGGEIVFPCANDRFTDGDEVRVNGRALPPGNYALQLRGIDRADEPWRTAQGTDPLDPRLQGCTTDASACLDTEQVCACVPLEVREETTVAAPEFVLVPPPECEDGIDNDGDGLVDRADASCDVDAGMAGEGLPVGLTELRVSLTLLGQNPNANCSAVSLRRFQIEVLSDAGNTVVLDDTCSLDRPYLSTLRVPAGIYTFSALGLDAAGEPVTVAKTFDASISEVGGTVLQSIDFAPEDFIEPIEGRIRFSPVFVSALGLNADGQPIAPRSSCVGTPSPGVLDIVPGDLDIGSLEISFVNGHGGPLDVPVPLDDGTPLDGTEIECSAVLLTEQVTWGSYSTVLQALSTEGEVCFSNADAPTPMIPNEQLGVPMARVYAADGTVPDSCRECEVDTDCDADDSDWACIEGVCQRPCDTNVDCFSSELGDLGFVCDETDDHCHPPVAER